MPRRPIRILCLHGWRTNSRVLEAQTSALRQAFGSTAEFVYVDAPWSASGPIPDPVCLSFGTTGPFYQWWDAQPLSSSTNNNTNSVNTNSVNTNSVISQSPRSCSYVGLERSLDHLTRAIDALGPLDAVLGFSQGAAMATLLTAHYLSLPSEASPASVTPYRVCVLVAGFDPETPETLELLRKGGQSSANDALDVPSVHVVGTTDALVAPLASEKLQRRFSSHRRVRFEHEGGHAFPSGDQYLLAAVQGLGNGSAGEHGSSVDVIVERREIERERRDELVDAQAGSAST